MKVTLFSANGTKCEFLNLFYRKMYDRSGPAPGSLPQQAGARVGAAERSTLDQCFSKFSMHKITWRAVKNIDFWVLLQRF